MAKKAASPKTGVTITKSAGQPNREAAGAHGPTNVMVVGAAPAMAMGAGYQTASAHTALMTANAVQAQLQTNMVHQTTTVTAVAQLLASGNDK